MAQSASDGDVTLVWRHTALEKALGQSVVRAVTPACQLSSPARISDIV